MTRPTVLIPGTRTAVLSNPSKMPGAAFGITAVRSCPSAFFGKNAICGESKTETHCYATKGNYQWAAVHAAQETRFAWCVKASMAPDLADAWVETMVRAIRQVKSVWFRIHDSGDFFNPQYTRLWIRVCQSMPDVSFWAPTRQYRTKNLHMLAALHDLNALPNVSVRPSALHFEDAPPELEGFSAGTSAARNGFNCPAFQQNNECGDCRTCWNKITPVVYHRH